ncbi:HD domain-containing protein [Lacticaseibacillus jixiensis]|uniref:HD domain-containing protein n=1 Tax=Lacticaseibacillus jixiensis TaxID=3231926 RepID=UPI0036F34183
MDQEILTNYAKQGAALDHSGHAFDHIQRVVANAQLLLQQTPQADAAVVLAAAVLHDTYDDKLVASVTIAKRRTKQVLAQAGATVAQQEAIIAIIDHMSFKANLAAHQVLSLEGQLVQDADRLDAIGAVGIARTFMYGGAHGSRMYDPKRLPRHHLDETAYRSDESTVLNHFDEKLFKLAAQMNTPQAKAIAAKRDAVMHEFVAEFLAEVTGRA